MNTRYFIFAVLILGLAACNKFNEEELTSSSVAAEIHASISNIVTHASDNEWETGDAIGITCVADNGGETNYTNRSYQWDGSQFKPTNAIHTIYFHDSKPAVFSADYPYCGNPNTAPEPVSIDTNTDQIDYLFATGATGSRENPQVSFTNKNATDETDPAKDHSCHHCMSRMTFNIQTEGEVGLDNVEGYALLDLVCNGEFDPKTGIATATGDGESVEFTLDATGSYTTLVLPQTSTDLKLSVTYQGEEHTANLPPEGGALEVGSHYIMNVTLHRTGLTVSCTIGEWSIGNSESGITTLKDYDYDAATTTLSSIPKKG